MKFGSHERLVCKHGFQSARQGSWVPTLLPLSTPWLPKAPWWDWQPRDKQWSQSTVYNEQIFQKLKATNHSRGEQASQEWESMIN